MIITKLGGGLGNQMFQYALGRTLSLKLNTELKMDVTKFEGWQFPTYRHYELDFFNIKENFATKGEIKALKGSAMVAKNVFMHLYDKHNPFKKKSYHKEKNTFKFDPQILKLPDNSMIDGYWQTELYFKDIAQTIGEDFSLRQIPAGQYEEFARKISNCSNSVVLHIRRGDYVSNKYTLSVHGVCSVDYYKQAVSIIKEKVSNPFFFVFSDDPAIARDLVKEILDDNTYEFIQTGKGELDMSLMRLSKHFIIANSSFSWWAAWLSENKEKNIIAPKRWLNNDTHDTSDLIPHSWLRI